VVQARFEELLRIHPPEAVERRRFEKIATALGTRTTQQVSVSAAWHECSFKFFPGVLSGSVDSSTMYTYAP